MDGSSTASIPEIDALTHGVSVRLLCRHFESWGLSDAERARAAAGRVLETCQRLARSGVETDPLEVATQWIRSMAGTNHEGGDWFFRARSLLGRFPTAFLETEVPPPCREPAELALLPDESPRAMLEQELVGPMARVVGVARRAFEDALPAVGAEPFSR
jgi:hypothetical protein